MKRSSCSPASPANRVGACARASRPRKFCSRKNEVGAAQRLLDSVNAKSDSERRERRLLGGRIAWATNRPQRALNMYASILRRPRGARHAVLQATLFALADAHLRLGTPENGDDFLENYIEHYPGDEALPALFAKLDQLYAAERRQARHDLGRWSREPAQPRRALAQWYLARAELRLGHREAALAAFAQLRAEHPPLPDLADAFIEFAQLKLQDGQTEEARAILEKARALPVSGAARERVDFAIARAEFAGGNYVHAAETFLRVEQPAARFNASLAWMEAEKAPEAATAAQALADRGAATDLALEDALLKARRGEPEALVQFTRTSPKHPRAAEAFVALAEMAFHAAPPRLEEAGQFLARAAEAPADPAASERADYLRIWLDEAAPNETKAIARANEFVAKYPQSALLPEVRLKLAELHYRRQDFANAQTQFEILAQIDPAAPLARKALFFAAEAAMQSMNPGALERALELFDEVVKAGGEWKWAARNEQAVIERKLGKPQDALTLYEEVLKGDAAAPEKREARCGQGDVLYDLGANAPENYTRAIEAYNQLANESGVPAHWKNQALFKKGMCLERLEKPEEALAAFYEVLDDGGRPDRRREFFWFYKAGFNAARLLEEQNQWQPAAAIYEKLAFAGGARSEEAKGRLSRLRLEHFLWEE